MSSRVWIFDLDDTLHDASSRIFPVMNRAMTQYIQDHLAIEEHEACALRQHYWRVYGATLKGLVRHHGVDPHHFLQSTHAFLSNEMIVQTERLRHLLRSLKGRKVVFTNAPKHYAMHVLEVLVIPDQFELVFSVENTRFHAKPSPRGFTMLLRKLKCRPADCIMLEDSLSALMTAKRLGMRTIWVSAKRRLPNFVDFRLDKVSALTHLRL
jgi:putative hydrolase of the HAD superfamily